VSGLLHAPAALPPGKEKKDNYEGELEKIWEEVDIKVKLSLCLTKHHVMETYWGSGGIAPRIL
jgi:hypothetical protein